MTELHDLLDRATDRLRGDPALAERALAGARRQRIVRRGALAAGVLGVMVVVAAVGLARPHHDSAPPLTPVPTTPTGPTPLGKLTQPPWDPRDVDQLPESSGSATTLLPDVVSPPATATPVADKPVDAAVLAIRGDHAILLLTPDDAWRSVPLAGQGGHAAALSADGTRLAVDSPTGVDIWNLPTGAHTQIPFPSNHAPSESHRWAWIDDATLLFDDSSTGDWAVDTASGSATRVPYPGDVLAWTVDSEGAVVSSSDYLTPARLTDWAGGQPRRVGTGAKGLGIGRLTSLVADPDTIVGTSGAGYVVIDRGDLEPRHLLPLVDPQDNYGDGKAPVVALLADQTVLVQVPVFGDEFSWRLVAWDPRSGELTRVVRGVGPVPASYAAGLLG